MPQVVKTHVIEHRHEVIEGNAFNKKTIRNRGT